MIWTGDKLRKLRLKLGWSRSHMARHLSCDLLSLYEWEKDENIMDRTFVELLERLSFDQKKYSEETSNSSIADSVLNGENKNQLTNEEIRKCLEGR